MKRSIKLKNLTDLNNLVKICRCQSCKVKEENDKYGIPMCDIKPKANPDIIFLGRDPNSWSNKGIVGELLNEKPKFHREIIDILQKSNIEQEKVYITNLLKCHWYCKKNNIQQLQYRKNIKNTSFDSHLKECGDIWFMNEVKLTNPKLIVSFGEDNFIYLKNKIIYPKSILNDFREAENWQINNGLMKIELNEKEYPIVILRHPGNFMNKSSEEYKKNEKIKANLIKYIRKMNC